MSLSKAVLCTAVLLFLLCVALASTSPPSSACPLACLCERGTHVNCSSLDLREAPPHIPVTVMSLDLSHNALRSLPPLWPGPGALGGLRHLWLGHNNMGSLSLCVRRGRVGQKASARERCVSWAPALQQLFAERNQMHQVPKGLGESASLRVLDLSHNRISALGPSDFQGSGHLRELHLQGNLIRTIHPLAFKDLQQLQALDLRFNLLTSIPSPVYLSLLNLRAQVDLRSNRWRCDCNLRGIRNRIKQTIPDQKSQSWRLVCSSPLHHAGKELVHLMDQDLTCPGATYGHVDHFDEVAEEGTQVLLPCGTNVQDCSQARWWTPQGQATGTQHGLLITDITERDAGLYVCVSDQREEQVSVFDLHVLEEAGTRLRRAALDTDSPSTDENKRNQRNTAGKTLGEFNLAICLSVFITFIVAFIIGVLVRPCLETLWKKIRSKKSPSVPVTVTDIPVQDSQVYDNEGFAMAEEPGEVRVGQRVTFSEDTEPFYNNDDIDDNSSESSVENERPNHDDDQNSVVVENLEMQQQSSRDAQKPLDSVQGEQQGNGISEKSKVMEFEPIPDPDEPIKGTSSISSESSIADQKQELPDNTYDNVPHTTQKLKGGEPQVDGTVEQNTSQHSSISPVLKPVAVPVFSPKPFEEWATQLMETKMNMKDDQMNPLDPELWNDSGESFSFTDGSEKSSMQDTSVTQPVGVLPPAESKRDAAPPQSKLLEVQADDDEVPDDIGYDDTSRPCSSTDSVDSGDGPTEYTVNPENNEEKEVEQTLDTTLPGNAISIQPDTTAAPSRQDDFLGNRPRIDTVVLEPEDIKFTTIHDSSDHGPFDEGLVFSERDLVSQTRPVAPQLPNYPAQPDTFSSSEEEEEPKKYNVHPIYKRKPVLHSTNSESYSERTSLSSLNDDEEEPMRYQPQINTTKPGIESRPITITTPSLNATSDLPIKLPDRVLNIHFDDSSTNTDDLEIADMAGKKSGSFEAPSHPPPPPPSQIEGMMIGVSLDHIPLPKRALVFGVKDSVDHKQVQEMSQRQSSLSSTSGPVVMPGLTGSVVSSQSRPSISSQGSASSVENDNFETNTDDLDRTDITGKRTSSFRRPGHSPPSPPSQMEGMMKGVSLDHIPLPNRALVFGVKDSVDHKQVQEMSQRQSSLSSTSGAVLMPGLTGSVVSSQSRPSISSQDSASSVENDNFDTTDITDKKTSSGPPEHPPPPPPCQMEGMMEGVSLDHIPLPKRALVFGLKDSMDHGQVPVYQRQSSLGFSSNVDVAPNVSGSEVSLNTQPVAKRPLFVIKSEAEAVQVNNAANHNNLSRPSISSQSSASSDENDSKEQMNMYLDRLPRPKKTLLFTSTMDDPVTQRGITASAQHDTKLPSLKDSYQVNMGTDSKGSLDEDPFSLRKIPIPKQSLIFTTSKGAQFDEREQSIKTEHEKRQPHSSLSSQGSFSSESDYKGGNSLAFDHLPKPKTSLLFTSSDFSTSVQKRLVDNVEPEPDRPSLQVSPRVPLSTNSYAGKVDEFSLNQLPMPKRYLEFTAPKDAAVLEREQVVEKQHMQKASLSSVSSQDSAVGDVSNEEKPLTFDQLPKPKRSLLFTSSEDTKVQPPTHTTKAETKLSGLSYSSKVTTTTDSKGLTDRDDQFSLDHLPTIKRSLAFSYSRDTDTKTDLLTDKVIERKHSFSSVSSESSDNSNGGDPTREGNYTLDGLPLPKRSLKFTTPSDINTFPDAVAPPTQRYQPPLTSQTDAPGTLQSFPSTDLNSRLEGSTSEGQQNQDWKTYTPRRRAMDGFAASSLTSSTSSSLSTGSLTSLSSYGGAIPYHSDHTFRSVSTGGAATTLGSLEVSDMGDNLPIIRRPKRVLQFRIKKDGEEV